MPEHPPATATPRNLRSQSLEWRAAELNRALALVRPVSMSDETASDWLAAAIAETADMSDELFRQGVTEARRACTFHGQLVPAIRAPQKRVDDYRVSIGLAPVGLIEAAKPAMHLEGPRGGARMLGDVIKRLEHGDD